MREGAAPAAGLRLNRLHQEARIFASILHGACISSPAHTANLPGSLPATSRPALEGVSMTSIESDPATQLPSAIPRKSVDRFLWGFPLFALGCEAFLVALNYLERINGSFIVTLLFFALIVLIMLVIALVGIVALLKGRFKCAAALLLAPCMILAPFLFPILRYEEFALDFIRFQLTKGTYAEVVDKLSPAERASRILFFDWGSEGLAGISGSSEY
jgi:hypothetical protein